MWRAGATMARHGPAPLAVRFQDLLSSSDCEVEESSSVRNGAAISATSTAAAWRNWSWGALRRHGAGRFRTTAPKVGNPYSYRGATYQPGRVRS